jgi:hypothetical protein
MQNVQKIPAETPTGRLYKGDLVKASELAAVNFTALPVQTLVRKTAWGELPPTFVVTKLQANGWGTYTMHYFVPKTGQRTYRDIPKDFTLNVLTGTRGKELQKEWDAARTNNLASFGQRMVATLGTDPEIFVVNDSGEVIPAWTYLPGKDKPENFRLNNCNGTAYWDGFQAEFTTRGTDTCLSWVNDNVQAGLKTIHLAAKKVGGKLTIDSVLPVNPDILQTEAQEHVQFGCAPSFNVYGLQGNIEDGRNVPFRFAGGHLHFGISNKDPERIKRFVKALDMVLGVASVSLLGELDNPIRRQFYGLPGEYRTPAHGFEYRTLSNAWLCHPLALNIVFDLARSVCGLEDNKLLDGWKSDEAETLEIIIKNDIDKAREVLDRNKLMFRQICKVIRGPYYQTNEQLDLAFNVWRNGISTAVANPRDIVGNWGLEGHWTLHGDGPGKNWDRANRFLVAGQKV